MNTIRLTTDTFTLYDPGDNRIMDIPPRYEITAATRLIVRLQSTRGGNNAWWRAGDTARACLNQAPYEPLFRGIVTNFQWDPPNTSDCPSFVGTEWGVAPAEIVQGGSAVTNWTAITAKPIHDPLVHIIRKMNVEGSRTDWDGGNPHCWQCATQGHAEIFIYDSEKHRRGFEKLLRMGSGNAWFYNHALINHRGYAYRVIDGTAYAVVLPQAKGLKILSPDHPDEGHTYTAYEDQFVVITHPLPSGDHDID